MTLPCPRPRSAARNPGNWFCRSMPGLSHAWVPSQADGFGSRHLEFMGGLGTWNAPLRRNEEA